MYITCYDSPYALIWLEGKSIVIEEVPRPKMNPEYAVYACNSVGNKELIMKHESYNYAKNLVIEIMDRVKNLRGGAYNPSYVRRYNGSPDKAIFG